MADKIIVTARELKILGSQYTILFMKDGIYIDVEKFWKENCNMRSDLFPPPEYQIGLLAAFGDAIQEIHICPLEKLHSALASIPGGHHGWRDYISNSKLDRMLNIVDSISDLECFGTTGTLYLNSDTVNSGWEYGYL
ncbi:hypothetical protein HOU08_gp268 [Dickeya phage vB_DsoM_JA29]|uniref:Uncharacterized protein n=1 Tax=Dickeya phage vB_DsoM_JA29 TaxID=2283031 RepID=A0A384ZXN0_9CAUD|nr:hypothetical protein HOU08_gp268 [Dickeya phage vB_DsoM_JA29]AXG66994.1 hypothetical protein JA29_268 [Dickeya phage vB_DsoM_JA29]